MSSILIIGSKHETTMKPEALGHLTYGRRDDPFAVTPVASNDSTNQAGDRAESVVFAAFLTAGYNVSIPFGDYRYDLVVEVNGKLLKIQVKAGRKDEKGTPAIVANAVSNDDRGYDEDVDYIFIWCPDYPEQIYYVKPRPGEKRIYLYLESTKRRPNPGKETRMAADHEFFWGTHSGTRFKKVFAKNITGGVMAQFVD